jgi:hypothetical protein
MKPGDLVKVNNSLHDPSFPDSKVGVVVERLESTKLYKVCFVNGFVTNIFIDHLELISEN